MIVALTIPHEGLLLFTATYIIVTFSIINEYPSNSNTYEPVVLF